HRRVRHPAGRPRPTAQFRPELPVYSIINITHNLEAEWSSAAVSDDTLLAHAVENFFNYGRAHWKWVSTCNTAKNDLLNGNPTKAYCAQFNENFKEFAVEILCFAPSDFKPIEITGTFVTKKCSVIDGKWRGNVMVDTGKGAWDYRVLNVYAF